MMIVTAMMMIVTTMMNMTKKSVDHLGQLTQMREGARQDRGDRVVSESQHLEVDKNEQGIKTKQ